MTGDELDEPPPVDPPEFLTVDELAAYLRIPKNTIYFWRSRNLGPPAHVVGKHLRFHRPDVVAWLLAQPARLR